MFTSIIEMTEDVISVESALMCIAASLILGLIAAFVYLKTTERYTKGFLMTLALLPVLVQAVILMTSGNLGTAVAVLGTFSLIRFRSVQGTAKEILGIFFAMVIGLACGMGQIGFAALITVIISVMFFVLTYSSFGGTDENRKHLRITIPEELDYTDVFDDIFNKYLSKRTLNKVKTVNLGSMYELDYDIVLRDRKDEKKMIDELRVRNGNLAIVCGKTPTNGAEL